MQYIDFYNIIIRPIILLTFFILPISGLVAIFIEESFLRLLIILCTTTIIFIISCWRFVFSPKEKTIITSAVMSLLKEIRTKLY